MERTSKFFGTCAVLRKELVSPKRVQSVPYVGLEHIDGESQTLLNHGFSQDADSTKLRFKRGDILFGKLRPYLQKVSLAPFDGVCSTDIWVVRAAPRTDQRFLFYLMTSQDFIREAVRSSEGTKMPRARWDFLARSEYKFPAQREQESIAGFLSNVDMAIQKTRQLIEKYRRLKRGLMQDLFQFGVDDHNNIRSERTHYFEDSTKGRMPSGWVQLKVGDCFRVRRGASPRPIDDPKYFSENGRGWIRISDVTGTYKHLKKTKQYLSRQGERQSVSVDPGDLIMSICATIGKPALVEIQACIHDGFVLFFDSSKDIDKEFFFYFLDHKTDEIKKLNQTGTQGNLNTGLVRNYSFVAPRRPEQRIIANILSVADDTIEKEEAYEQKLLALKRGLIEELVLGHEGRNYLTERDYYAKNNRRGKIVD